MTDKVNEILGVDLAVVVEVCNIFAEADVAPVVEEADEADEILDKLATETDEATLKQYYTRLNEIYLTDVPSFGLMYRPDMFYTVNESVWTGYPMQDDGTNIPPADCTDGYGIAALYNLELVEG